MTRPRLGFLGTGWIGRHRLAAIAESGIAEIAIIVDPSDHCAQQALALAPTATVLPSFAELLDAQIDGVVIATPSALHAEQAIAALERGLAVFCQKPLGRSALETRQVVDAARAADRFLGADFSYRHTAAARALEEMISAGELGDIFAGDLTFHNAYGPDKPWFYDRAMAGGGCVMDLGVHLIDLALWLNGFPTVTSVDARMFAKGRPVARADGAVEDYALARFDLSPGATVQLACSWNLAAGQEARIETSFYGTRGGACLRNVGGSFYDFELLRFSGTETERVVAPPDAWGGRAAAAWARQLAKSATFDPAAEHYVASAEVIDRIYAATDCSDNPALPHRQGSSPPL